MYSLIVIDDEIELLEGLENHFPWEKYGFTVQESFSNGNDALHWLESHTTDVILTDICMPSISGLDLISKIKHDCSNTPLFCLLSAHQDFSYAQEGIKLGVKHYLLKPTNFDEIGDAFTSIREELDRVNNSYFETNNNYSIQIQRAINIIEAKPELASLQSVSDAVGVNPSYLSRLFKEDTGENFSSILTKIKMEKAKELLLSKYSYSNKDIAELLGYGESQNFCRTFRKYFSMTPQKYKKEHLNEL